MRYLGVDYGSSKVGLALSDEGGIMGFPHAIIPNTPRLAEDLVALIQREQVGAVVVGESRTLAGEPNPVNAGAHALGEALAARSGVPVAYESEAYTSAEARRAPGPFFAEATKDKKPRKTRKRASREPVDASAAALILTSYLSRSHGA